MPHICYGQMESKKMIHILGKHNVKETHTLLFQEVDDLKLVCQCLSMPAKAGLQSVFNLYRFKPCRCVRYRLILFFVTSRIAIKNVTMSSRVGKNLDQIFHFFSGRIVLNHQQNTYQQNFYFHISSRVDVRAFKSHCGMFFGRSYSVCLMTKNITLTD